MRKLVFSSGAERKFRRFDQKHPELRAKVTRVVHALRENPLDLSVGAHKLTGRLRFFHGADITFRYRIVYDFDDAALYLLNIGTHDETYGRD